VREKAVLVLNPVAGKRKKIKESILKILSTKYNLEIFQSEGKKETLKILYSLKPETVIIAGGDGTINSVLPYIYETGATLGILPFGSGNGLARNLKIPLNPERAARKLLKPKRLRVDLGIINDEIYFINVAGVGFDGYIAHEFEKSEKRGIPPYVISGLKGYFNFSEFNYKFEDKEGKAFLIAFANFQQYGGEARIAPGAKPGDGYIDIVFLRKPPLSYAIANFPRLFTGRLEKLKLYNKIRRKELKIDITPPQLSHHDGEAGPLLSHINLTVKKRAINLLR